MADRGFAEVPYSTNLKSFTRPIKIFNFIVSKIILRKESTKSHLKLVRLFTFVISDNKNYNTNVLTFAEFSVYLSFLPVQLECFFSLLRFSKLNFQIPAGFSPQNCTDMVVQSNRWDL